MTNHSSVDDRVGVFGFGNPLRGDDGIVSVLFERVRRENMGAGAAEFIEFGARTFRIVHTFGEFDRVILVDAMRFGGKPGEVIVCAPDEIVSRVDSPGSHELDLLEIVDLASRLANNDVVIKIFGIEPGPMSMGATLSERLENRLPAIQDTLQETIKSI